MMLKAPAHLLFPATSLNCAVDAFAPFMYSPAFSPKGALWATGV